MSIVSSKFFQNISRTDSETYVTNNDKIVLRHSNTFPDCFVLTLFRNGNIEHNLLREISYGGIERLTFDSNRDLLAIYANIDVMYECLFILNFF